MFPATYGTCLDLLLECSIPMSLSTVIFYTLAVILQKISEIVGEFFSSSGNEVLSILLKYQEIDVQIQTFTDED